LLRKYGETEEDVLEHAARAREEAARLADADADRAACEAADARLRAAADAAAAGLTARRREAATRLGPAVTDALQGLGFLSVTFSVAVDPAPLDVTGADAISFLLAPNPGEPQKPLARIASGGELSRVALAIRGVLATGEPTTLVFDEIDAGIGGRSADPVGRSLWTLARHHQVLCVTHLPQIAAWADAHLHIAKSVREGRTATEIRPLDDDARVTELATMLAGGAGEAAAQATARELVGHARAAKAAAGARGAPADGA
jgi:DNA repair protein RecN (Recombination protein N)